MFSSHTQVVDGAIVVSRYEDLGRFVEAFAQGHLNLLILVGGAGLAKSQMLRRAVGQEACWIQGQATPFAMYAQLWHHRDHLVVIDDVDNLHGSASGIRLLKCLCQTDAEKRVSWLSAAASLDQQGIPREFTTTSKVAIISNDWKNLSANVAAVQDRGHVVHFRPTATEVHHQAAHWFQDAEIYEYFGQHVHLLEELSLRHYVRAAELKRAGMDWKQLVPFPVVGSKTLLVARLKADPRFPTEEARAQAFVEAGAGCRATYFNHARKLHKEQGTIDRKAA